MSKRLTKARRRFFPKKKKVKKEKKPKAKPKQVKFEKKPTLMGIREEIEKTKFLSPPQLKKKQVVDVRRKRRIQALVMSKSKRFPENYVIWNARYDKYEIVAFGDRITVSQDLYYIGRAGDFIAKEKKERKAKIKIPKAKIKIPRVRLRRKT